VDGPLVNLVSQGVNQFGQMGGFIGAHGDGVDLWEVVSGLEGRCMRERPLSR
jgi:hypothetical protein